MKDKAISVLLAWLIITLSVAGCGKPEAGNATTDAKEPVISEEKNDADVNEVSIEKGNEGEAAEMSDKELYEAFLKDKAEVHFTNYQPEKYFSISEYFYTADESATLDELIAAYDKYYLEELTYSDIYYNICYTYIDAGDMGKEQLVVECGFPQGTGAQFVIGVENGQLELMYVIDSMERMYGTVANKYGLISTTGSSSYAEYSVANQYLDGNGEIHNIYIESANYLFGQETIYADPLLEWAFEFRESEGFKDDVILRTYSFDDFEADFTAEDLEAYYDNMLYTVEYVTDEVPWHEDAMYEEGSVFSRIFEKAGRKLSTPEEVEAAIAKKMEELGMPMKARVEEPVLLTDLDDKEVGAILGADVDDGRSALEHALTAFEKYLKNPVNLCDMLTEQTYSPYGGAQPGMVYGFALRDFTDDGVPELVIDFGQPGYPLMSKIYIYALDESTGRVKTMFKMPDCAYGDNGIKYLKENMNESYVMWYNEDFENKASECPEYADALLYAKYQGPRMVGTCGRYLVTFDEGVEEDMYRNITWYDFVNDEAMNHTEVLNYVDGKLTLETYEACSEDPANIVDGFKPILFYDITGENIEKVVSEDYWNKNNGEGAFSDYSDEDAYGYLTEKSSWYFDLGIMDDDEFFDTINCYDYDEDTDTSTTIFFDLDLRIQSHFRVFNY